MNYSDDIVMRYLFGELSEAERTELETEYFDDPRAFDRLERFENDLIDDYARGRLKPETRLRFERAYLSDPNRRARLKFGEALTARLDQNEPSLAVASVGSWRQSILSSLGLARPALAFSMAVVLLLLAVGSVWLLIQFSRLRAEVAQLAATEASQEQREGELQQQLADEQKRNQELTAELQTALNSPAPETKPSPGIPTPAFVTLLLAASGVRGAETAPPPTLVIPKASEQVHVQLALKDHDYRNYQIVLRAIAGPEIFNRQDLKPRINKSGATFSFSLPASKLNSGDYMLTLKGGLPSGEFEDVSKSLFRVEKK